MSEHEISASWDDLLRQASMTSGTYFAQALRHMAEEAGERIPPARYGTATELAAISARDFQTSTYFLAASKIADALNSIADAIIYAADREAGE
jgi:hypothetical protein